MTLHYVSTDKADATLRVLKGSKTIATIKDDAAIGRNTIVWNGKGGAKGAYKLKLTLDGSDDQTGYGHRDS